MILMVDDNEHIIEWAQAVIEGAGYYYDSAHDSRSALYKIKRLNYSLVLIDIGLPDYPGDVLAFQVVSELSTPPPLIAITGGELVKAEGLFVHFMLKPFNANELKNAIAKFARPPVKDLHIAKGK